MPMMSDQAAPIGLGALPGLETLGVAAPPAADVVLRGGMSDWMRIDDRQGGRVYRTGAVTYPRYLPQQLG